MKNAFQGISSGISGYISSISHSGKEDSSKKGYVDGYIKEFYIGWYDLQIVKRWFYSIHIDFLGTNSILPSYLGGGKQLVHAFAYCILDNDKKYKVEYNREGIFTQEIELKDLMNDLESNHQNPNICILEINERQLLSEILSKTKKLKFTGNDYQILSTNCQNFVWVFIDELKAKRKEKYFYRGYHSISMEMFPVMVLNHLEKNEGDGNFFGYIPFVGGYIDGIRFMFSSLFK